MKDTTKNAPAEPTLAERRKRLAEALGFLLARAWLREHGPAVQDRPTSAESDRPQDDPVPRPP